MAKKLLIILSAIFLSVFSTPNISYATEGEWCCPPRGMDIIPGTFNFDTGMCDYSEPSGGVTSYAASCDENTEQCEFTTKRCIIQDTSPPEPSPDSIECNQTGESCCERSEDEQTPGVNKYYCTPPLGVSSQTAGCVCTSQNIAFTIQKYYICNNVTEEFKGACKDCMGDEVNGKSTGKMWTAVGCIGLSPTEFIADFIQIALGIAGGIALLLMVYGSFQISTSAGDPKKAESGKEMITGTIAGLLFIIFSVFLLKLIGVDILQIPGF